MPKRYLLAILALTGADLGGGGGGGGGGGYHLLQKSLYVFIITNLYPLCTFVSCMYLDGGMGGGGWLLTSFFSIIYILGLVCYKHTIHARFSMSDSFVDLPQEVVN